MLPALAVLALVLHAAVAGDTCAAPSLLPAYAHNDYRNPRPLLDALELGFRGVEADLFRIGSELLVGHDRRELQPSHSLSRLYLEPLRERQRACGFLLSDNTPFFLNVELKEADTTAFRYLLNELRAYEELFRSSARGADPPVRVTLVGWWPIVDAIQWPDYLGVQVVVERRRAATVPRNPPLIGLVSIDYRKVLRWRGRGDVPDADEKELAGARELAAGLTVPLRVHHAPIDRRVYKWLLSSGVTLIGTTHLSRTHLLLQEVLCQLPNGQRLKLTAPGLGEELRLCAR
jgi:hypothetical protein